MRCPKCSFISFDFQETCVKCGKNISAASEELHGTVASNAPPDFLKDVFAEAEAEETTVEERTEFEAEEYDLGDEEEETFVDLGTDEEGAEETLEMDIAEESVVEPEDATADEVVAEEAQPEEEALDMADLAPAEEEIETATDEFKVEQEEPEVETAGEAGQGLEDLKVDGIDLETSPAPPTEKGKVMPAAKTGTALDDFDIDLGDLLPKK